jgi:hypothetical protein
MGRNIEIILKFLIIIAFVLSLLIMSTFLRNIGMKSKLSAKTNELWTDFGEFLTPPSRDLIDRLKVPMELRLFQQPTNCFSCKKNKNSNILQRRI